MLRAVGAISLFTLLSRILGFVRDMIIARVLGAGMGADAFFVAQKLPNFLRRLFAEGAFSAAFVPVFSDYAQKEGEEGARQAREMVNAVFTTLSLILLGLMVVMQLAMPLIVMIEAPGFQMQDPAKFNLTVELSRVTLPFIFFVSLTALAAGVLNTYHHFAAPALAPCLLNLAIIAAGLWLSPRMDEPAMGLAWGLLLGGALQLLLQLPPLAKRGFHLRLLWRPDHPAIRRILTIMAPALLGVSVAQISFLIDIFIASWLPEGSISYLYYADRVMELPLGLVGVAMGAAILPALSAHASRGDMASLRHDLDFALRMVTFINLPAAVGLIVLRDPVIQLLFQRGAFGPDAARLTADALLAFSLGLIGYSAVKVLAPAFYALKEIRIPVRIAIVSLAATIVMNLLFMIPLKHVGLALSTALASYLNMILLIRQLKIRTGFTPGRRYLVTLGKSLTACIVMGGALLGGIELFWRNDLTMLQQTLVLLPLTACGALLYFAVAWLIRMEEIRALPGLFSRKRQGVGAKAGE
ncbi:MAG: murein biosynthesis integral membrane protein MurJ [Magnetococcales bacterium]|nr:murein biosynthesis integral membrane protein MurJ [Magnetococcales bacterium]